MCLYHYKRQYTFLWNWTSMDRRENLIQKTAFMSPLSGPDQILFWFQSNKLWGAGYLLACACHWGTGRHICLWISERTIDKSPWRQALQRALHCSKRIKKKQNAEKIILRMVCVRECLISRNPLTAKGAEVFRKVRKELNSSIIALRSLRLLCVLCG